MKHPEALQRRETLLKGLNERLAGLELAPLVDDGKLYQDGLEGDRRWMQRLSRPSWPHVAAGQAPVATPGLRYEVWYSQKQAVARVALLNSRHPLSAPLTRALEPLWRGLLEHGASPQRYQPLEGGWGRLYPNTDGICCALPIDEKLEAGLFALVTATLPGLEQALATIDPEGTLAKTFRDAAQASNPLAGLAAKFNKGR